MLTKPYDEIRIKKHELAYVDSILHETDQLKPYLMFALYADELEWHEDIDTQEIVVRYKRNLLQYG